MTCALRERRVTQIRIAAKDWRFKSTDRHLVEQGANEDARPGAYPCK